VQVRVPIVKTLRPAVLVDAGRYLRIRGVACVATL
jgi:hypothetical protein